MVVCVRVTVYEPCTTCVRVVVAFARLQGEWGVRSVLSETTLKSDHRTVMKHRRYPSPGEVLKRTVGVERFYTCKNSFFFQFGRSASPRIRVNVCFLQKIGQNQQLCLLT